MRTIVVGDVHGGLRALKSVLEKIESSPQDLFIFLGDYVDGWSDAAATLDFLIAFQHKHKCHYLRGNHDQLCLQWLTSGKDNPLWLQAGGLVTQQSYTGVGSATRKKHIRFLESLKDYHLDRDNRLYVHAGFTNPKGVLYEYDSKIFYWDRTLWEMALSLNPQLSTADKFYPLRLSQYKEIFIGHTALTKFGITTPMKAGNVWNIDTGAAHRGPLSALDVQTKIYWQSQPVHLLYPGEAGRN